MFIKSFLCFCCVACHYLRGILTNVFYTAQENISVKWKYSYVILNKCCNNSFSLHINVLIANVYINNPVISTR